jgi:hypothetical protein
VSRTNKSPAAPSATLSRLEIISGALAIVGLLVLGIILFFALSYHSFQVRMKQMTLDDTRANLLTALNDLQSSHFPSHPIIPADKSGFYGYNLIRANTNSVVVNGTNYQFALSTVSSYKLAEYGFAITTNGTLIWLPFKGTCKIIPEIYKVSFWQRGY